MTLIARGLGAAAVVVLASTLTPLPNALARRLEVAPRLERADAVVVLGNGVNPDGSLEDDSLRGMVHGVGLLAQGLAPVLVLSGGRSGPYHEAEVRARLARGLGVREDAIVLETAARTTGEEAARIGARLRARGATRILLVTNAIHLVRASRFFEGAGLQVLPAPPARPSEAFKAPAERLHLLALLLREAAAALYARLGGGP
ncbi:MAG TPA: YdcF family protein [Methylomirabilota bacterium]|jgi:uncharacterized SAM-binding protein YcdF (DUF218 family)|nr:YdcF family protein [Methylomirabilota bacterium]